MTAPRFLIIDDERNFREFLGEALKRQGYDVAHAGTARVGLAMARHTLPRIVLLDQNLPDGSGLDFIRELRELPSNPAIIMITAFAGYDSAVRAVKAGAFHYLSKPFGFSELLEVVAEASVAFPSLDDESQDGALGALLGADPKMVELRHRVARVAMLPVPTVLVRGESGTGKELVAQAVHTASARADKKMVSVNCAALTETLLMDELFGHERGAYTDARSQKCGVFESAHGGTLFLDEISEMGPRAQAALLRVLEERKVRRVGGSEELEVDVRVVAATNCDLDREMEAGHFRSDLFFRLNLVELVLPALRERRGDIALLAAHFARLVAERYGEPVRTITPDTQALLHAYRWPGNVRELRNVIERAYVIASGPCITPECLPEELLRSPGGPDDPVLAGPPRRFQDHKRDVVDHFERSYLESALLRAGGNITQAAEEAGMLRQVFQRMLIRHGIDGAQFRR
ncbi:MAG TPA: sigma-54 dependent transcriptional regulator [Gemmatimonadaceae bacterium]